MSLNDTCPKPEGRLAPRGKGAAAHERYRPPERVHHHHASLFQHEHHLWVSAARSRDRARLLHSILVVRGRLVELPGAG